ncbi:hypothetical protein BGW80DRAFT_1391275, partial [Lactifluus volemus]
MTVLAYNLISLIPEGTTLILKRDETRASTWEAHPSRALNGHYETSLLHFLFTSRPPDSKFAVAGRFYTLAQASARKTFKRWSRHVVNPWRAPRASHVVIREHAHTPVATTTASCRARPSTLIRSWCRRG